MRKVRHPLLLYLDIKNNKLETFDNNGSLHLKKYGTDEYVINYDDKTDDFIYNIKIYTK